LTVSAVAMTDGSRCCNWKVAGRFATGWWVCDAELNVVQFVSGVDEITQINEGRGSLYMQGRSLPSPCVSTYVPIHWTPVWKEPPLLRRSFHQGSLLDANLIIVPVIGRKVKVA
jgi:hypothetical protein